MSLFTCALNSGSNGNCYYVGNESEAILVDAGISCREIEKRMKRLALDIHKVKAVFISHEHTDHISGVQVLSKKYKLPVYITHVTHRFGRLRLEKDLIISFSAHMPVTIGKLSITAFPKFHDAADPYSFVISCDEIKVGVFTDIGTPCENLVHHFKQCHTAFLESNYDETMLQNGRYPHYLKNRIRGDKGHLSNKQALDLFTAHRPLFMSHLFLSHISKNNNCPRLVQQLFDEYAAGVKMIVASRYEETPVYHIHNSNTVVSMRQPGIPSQLSFAFA